jgi:two-component system, cell cycle response regulator DivK
MNQPSTTLAWPVPEGRRFAPTPQPARRGGAAARRAGPNETLPRPSGSAAPRPRHRPLILVVEDDLHDWEIYGKMLWYNGFDVLLSSSLARAFDLAVRHAPDLILLDFRLPDGDGRTLARRLRNEARTASMPIVALTARSRREVAREADELGFAAYLEKPVGPVAVLNEVERLVGRPPPAGADGSREPSVSGAA